MAIDDGKRSFASALVRICPPWLQRLIGGSFMQALGDPLDDIRDKTAEGVRARLPDGGREDALAYIGRDRRIVRGLGEDPTTYAGRLVRWWDDHRVRGNPYALLYQLRAYYAASPKQIDLVYETGARFSLHVDGTITRDSIEWREGSDPLKWCMAFVFVWYEDEPTITFEEAQSVISIVSDWTPAHILRPYIWGLFPGGGDLWDYPEGVLWDADDTEVWDEPHAINFYEIEEPYYLTVDGDFVTVDGDYVVVYP